MSWLERLKSANTPDTDATKATKPGFVGFVAYPAGAFEKSKANSRAANDAEPDAEDGAEWIDERAAVLEYDAGLSRADAARRAAELFEVWRTVDRVYLAHHWGCPICIGAGQGRGLRFGVGAALWTNYENTPRSQND